VSASAFNKFSLALVVSVSLMLQFVGATPANAAQQNVTVGTVSVTGAKNIGQTLTANLSGWAPAGLTYSYQWLRNGVVIKGATASTYVLQESDFEVIYSMGPIRNITVKVTASAPNYKKTSVVSVPTLANNGKPCTLIGTSGNDIFIGSTSKDVFCGLAGNDVFQYSKGPDFVDAGDGSDTIDLGDQLKNATVDLTAGTAVVKGGTVTTFSSIENVVTGRGADRIIGNDQPNVIRSYSFEWFQDDGADYIESRGGDDSIQTGGGDDQILGGDGDDSLIGGYGDDTIDGGSGTNFCDVNDSFDDLTTNCTEFEGMPTLTSAVIPTHGIGEMLFTVSDNLAAVQWVELSFKNNQGEEARPEGTARIATSTGRTSTWSFSFPEEQISEDGWIQPGSSAHSPGDWFPVLNVVTTDGRDTTFIGNADGTYSRYDGLYGFYGDVTDRDPDWVSGNIGPSSVVLNWDADAPIVTVANVATTSIDTSAEAKTVNVAISVTDNVSHAFKATCTLVEFNPYLELRGVTGTSEFTDSGTCSMNVPKDTPAGTYAVWLEVRDEIGNQTRLIPTASNKFDLITGREYDEYNQVLPSEEVLANSYTSDIQLELTQTGAGNDLSPELAEITWSAATVSTRTSAQRVTATLSFNGISGETSTLSCFVKGPSIRAQEIMGEAVLQEGSSNIYKVVFDIPKKAPKGKYSIGCMAKDSVGWVSTFWGQPDGTFVKEGVNSQTPVANPGQSYFRVG
jgi:Ca2+-binding RTX toxin-like protein